MVIVPDKIENLAGKSLRITWPDGRVSEHPFRQLRQACPCALCKDEWTGKSLLDPDSVAADLSVEKADVVGNYALSFKFSDGHSSGVYTFELLRAASENPSLPS